MTNITISNAPITEETPNYIKVSKYPQTSMVRGATIRMLKTRPICSADGDGLIESAYTVKNMYKLDMISKESVSFSEHRKAIAKYLKETYPDIRINHTITDISISYVDRKHLWCTVYELDKRVPIRPNKSNERKRNKQAILDTFIMPTIDMVLYKYGLRRDKNNIYLTNGFINNALTEALNKVLSEISDAGVILDNPTAESIVFKGCTTNTRQNRLATVKGINSSVIPE